MHFLMKFLEEYFPLRGMNCHSFLIPFISAAGQYPVEEMD